MADERSQSRSSLRTFGGVAYAELERDLRNVIARLELVSHVSAVSLDANGGPDAGDDIGGKRPPGGVDRRDERRDDAEHIYQLKSADHYRRRMLNARTDHALLEIKADAERSLNAWQHQPEHDPKSDPPMTSPLWKHWAAKEAATDQAVAEIAWKYGVSRAYVKQLRAQYCGAA